MFASRLGTSKNNIYSVHINVHYREHIMASVKATQARKEIFYLIKDAIKKHKEFRIHHRDGDVVLMSEEEYESLQETFDLLSIPGFRKA